MAENELREAALAEQDGTVVAATVLPSAYLNLRDAVARVERPSHLGYRTLFFALSLAAFAWSFRDRGAVGLAILVGVLLLHELGHYAAMKVLGYTDLRIFFIPFLGAAVSGRPSTPGGWRAGVVSLSGPVPGLVLGAVLVPWVAHAPDTWVSTLVVTLVVVNALNLAPFLPLDGGRLLGSVLFSRHPVLELAAMVAGVIALATQLDWQGGVATWALPGIAGGLLIQRARFLHHVHPLRSSLTLSAGPASTLPDDEFEHVLRATDRILEGVAVVSERNRASTLVAVHEAVRERPAELRDSLLLFTAWVVSCGIAFGAWSAYRSPAPAWRTVEGAEDGWSLSFPSGPSIEETPNPGPNVRTTRAVSATLRGAGAFGLVVATMDSDDGYFDHDPQVTEGALRAAANESARLGGAPISRQAMEEVAGHRALHTILNVKAASVEMFHLAIGNRIFVLSLQNVVARELADRFIGSLRLRPPAEAADHAAPAKAPTYTRAEFLEYTRTSSAALVCASASFKACDGLAPADCLVEVNVAVQACGYALYSQVPEVLDTAALTEWGRKFGRCSSSRAITALVAKGLMPPACVTRPAEEE